MVESGSIKEFIDKHFYEEYLEALREFVRIPSLSPAFDPEWQSNGNLNRACDHMVKFAESQDLRGAKITALKDEGKTPFLIVDIAASEDSATKHEVLLYGHMDKQPYGDGWETDPEDPLIKDGLLYGRGSVDDGYAFFMSILAIKACQTSGKSHPRCIITIEGCEEGETDDLIYYMATYKHLLGSPNIVICLDAGGTSHDTLTITSTLRGCFNFDLSARVATNNMHSGMASGIVPNPF